MLARVDARHVHAVIVAKLHRLTLSVKDLCELLDRFERRAVALIRTRDALRHKRRNLEQVGNTAYGYRPSGYRLHGEANQAEEAVISVMRQQRGEGRPNSVLVVR